MTRITGDDFMLIGLHKMASERGDGFIPEMLDVLRRRSETFDDRPALLPFPQGRSTGPLPAPRTASNENNVIDFPLARRRAMKR